MLSLQSSYLPSLARSAPSLWLTLRRLLAAAKRREAATLREIAVARGSLFPGGQRQERALNFIPLLARHGAPLVDAMRQSAARHAEALLQGRRLPADG